MSHNSHAQHPLPEVLGLLDLMDAADWKLEDDRRAMKSTNAQPTSAWSRYQPAKGRRGGHHMPSPQVSGGKFVLNTSYKKPVAPATHSKAGPSADEGGASACPPWPRPPRICYRCQKLGHFARECPSSGSNDAQNASSGSSPDHDRVRPQSAGRSRPAWGHGSYHQPRGGSHHNNSSRQLPSPPRVEMNTNHQVPGESEEESLGASQWVASN